MKIVHQKNPPLKSETPDIVLSLLGAGEKIPDDDLNGRNAYSKFLDEKYEWKGYYWIQIL